ncbi:hypothetical protein HNR19_003773 [Nocardioides thalensis]|uniref:Uncharacterized protein n=1 Tax=Nocardioides thalensis TaxID=1914755 RepID=A0A853C5K0_9ACTN|nr:hypothetical protein [Nocardioides thalensis]NYJ03075.1 hypothetical protein [Nocardioides thalensis]
MTTEPNDTQVLVRPEVATFVEEVRARLADLDADDRDELLGGLEADLSDQLADGTPLGDPAAYAAELRAAAGLPARRRSVTGDLPRTVGGILDAARAWFLGLVGRPGLRPAWDVVVALRPAWWVARAWIAVTALDIATGGWEEISVVPSLGVPGVGEVVLVAAVVMSTLVGLGRLWPGSGPERSTASRISLLLVNAVAVLAPMTWSLPYPAYVGYGFDYYDDYGAGYNDAQRENKGLRLDGDPVRNVFAYDLQGRPLPGVQLVDQDGDLLAAGPGSNARGRGEGRVVGCPAFNGRTAVYNVFPLAETRLRRGTCESEDAGSDAAFPEFPLASLPPVTNRPGDGAPTVLGRTSRSRDQ